MAERLPPELFDDITWYICNMSRCSTQAGYTGAPKERSDPLTKRELGACSLTCMYWAEQIRPHIFRETTLRSREDYISILNFAKSATVTPHVGTLITLNSANDIADFTMDPSRHSLLAGSPLLQPSMGLCIRYRLGGSRFYLYVVVDIPGPSQNA